jgi:hypothetical protein
VRVLKVATESRAYQVSAVGSLDGEMEYSGLLSLGDAFTLCPQPLFAGGLALRK